MKKYNIITIILGFIILTIGITTIYAHKQKVENIWQDISIQGIKMLEEILLFKEEMENIIKEDEVFADLDKLLEEITQTEENNMIKIAFFGDLMFDRDVSRKLTTKEKFDTFFGDLKDLELEKYDFVGANLETPVVSKLNECQYSEKSIKFCSKNVFLPRIKEYGFNIFALANNHSMDGGTSGHNATIRNLNEIGIDYFGSIKHGSYLNKTYSFTGSIRDVPFSWHSYDFTIYGDRYLNEYCEELENDKALGYNNFVVVHWGNEYQYMTHAKIQEDLAKKLIDCGADLIIGMHPHVIQDIEEYNGKTIIYSLGNFLFDQDWSENTQKGIGIFIEYKPNGEIKIETKERKTSV